MLVRSFALDELYVVQLPSRGTFVLFSSSSWTELVFCFSGLYRAELVPEGFINLKPDASSVFVPKNSFASLEKHRLERNNQMVPAKKDVG